MDTCILSKGKSIIDDEQFPLPDRGFTLYEKYG
jgi:hypothetical protein